MRLFSLLLFIGNCIFMCSEAVEQKNNFPQLVVRGEGILFKPADQLQITLGVVTQDVDPQKALTMNNEQMTHLIDSVSKVGLSRSEYQTGQFYIQPIYTQPPRDIPPDWHQKISHYEVSNNLQIKTQHLDLAGQLISAAAQAGANKISDIQFTVQDPRLYHAEAIEVAAKNAMSDAAVLAKATGVSIVGVRSVVLDHNQSRPFPMMAKANFDSYGGESTPIEAGDVEVRAAVDIVFEISSAFAPDSSSGKNAK